MPTATASRELTCAALAREHYVQAVEAARDGARVVVTTHPATLVCGGVDDSHFDVRPHRSQKLRMAASAPVYVVVYRSSGVASKAITAAELPHFLPADRNGRIFRVTGPSNDVRALAERYHP